MYVRTSSVHLSARSECHVMCAPCSCTAASLTHTGFRTEQSFCALKCIGARYLGHATCQHLRVIAALKKLLSAVFAISSERGTLVLSIYDALRRPCRLVSSRLHKLIEYAVKLLVKLRDASLSHRSHH
eukprot:10510-Heterococcus_DN1.PRE.2